MWYSYRIVHVPGKDLYTADVLSRAPLYQSLTKDEKQLNAELNLYVSHVMDYLPIIERRQLEIRLQLDEDEICSKLKEICREGWPENHCLKSALLPYWQYQGEITVQQDILMKGPETELSSLQPWDWTSWPRYMLVTRASKNAEKEQKVELGGQASASKLKIWLENVQHASRPRSIEPNRWFHRNCRYAHGRKLPRIYSTGKVKSSHWS